MSKILQMDINSVSPSSNSESNNEMESKKDGDMNDTDSDMVFEKLKKSKFKQQTVAA